MVLHLLYGVGAGLAFAVAYPALEAWLPLTGLANGAVWGLVYGVGLFVAGAAFWLNVVLDVNADRQTAMGFLFFHLVYGVVLGGWVGLGFLA